MQTLNTNIQEIENNQISNDQIVQTASLNADELKNIYNKVVEYFRANASLPGFRKGKADLKLIERNFKDRIDTQFQEDAKQMLINKFASDSKVGKITDISNINFAENMQKLEMDVKYYEAPSVPEITISDIEIVRAIMPEVTISDVNQFVTELFSSIINDKISHEEKLSEEIISKIQNNLDKSFEEKLNALNDAEVELIFECKREEVENIVKNRIRDEFVICAENYSKIQLFNQLDEKLNFKIPNYLLEEDIDNLEHIKKSLITESENFALKTEEEQKLFMQKYSIRRIKIGLFFAQYAKLNKINISNNDISAYLNHLKVNDYIQYFTIMQNPNKYIENIKSSVIEQKSINAILSAVKMNDSSMNYFELVKKLEEIEKNNIA